MWKILQSQYKGSRHNLKQSYLTELYLLRYEQFNSITAFVVRFKKLLTCLSQVDIKLPNDAYVITFINALESAFLIWAKQQRSNAQVSKIQSLEDLYTDITDEAQHLNKSSNDSNVALYTRKNRPKTKVICLGCKKLGHAVENC